MKTLEKLLKRLVGEEFYGELLIKFEKGKVVIMKETRTHKPVES